MQPLPEFWLWIDDRRPVPPEWAFVPHAHVTTAQSALAVLKTGIVTRVGFDHDLGDEIAVGNGAMIAREIEEMAFFGQIPRLEWSIQSANPAGAKNIRDAMERADTYWDLNRRDKHACD
jgi:hypothetical protein